MQPDYGPFGGPPVSIMHEVGHLISPDGGGASCPSGCRRPTPRPLPAQPGRAQAFTTPSTTPRARASAADRWWCDGTFGGPTFVDYIDERHPGFIHGLTAASLRIGKSNPWPGSDALFRMHTGQSFDALWSAYADAYQFRSGRPIEDCFDPRE